MKHRSPGTSSYSHRNRHAGLTVIELIITLAIAAILLASAIPSFAAFVERSRVNSALDQLQVSLNLARGEAIKRRDPVRVCPSVGGWANGWLVIEDSPDECDVNCDDGGDDPRCIRRIDSSSIHDSIEIDSSETLVKFNPTGDADTSGEFTICHDGSSVNSRILEVSAIGRVNTRDGEDSGCAVSES